MKKYINVLDVEQYNNDDFEFDGNLDDLIRELLRIRKDIPAEHRKNTTYDIDSRTSYDTSVALFKIKYHREETDAERVEREQKEQNNETQKAAKRRAEYEKLKREFET